MSHETMFGVVGLYLTFAIVKCKDQINNQTKKISSIVCIGFLAAKQILLKILL